MPASIGPHIFLTMKEHPEVPKEEVEVVKRPGVDGVGIWRTGKRGSPMTVTTTVDAASFAVGQAMYLSYSNLIANAAVAIIWEGLAMPFLVNVLDVRVITLNAISTSVGGINPPSGAVLVCEWDLISVNA